MRGVFENIVYGVGDNDTKGVWVFKGETKVGVQMC